MTTAEIADRLYTLFNDNQFDIAQKELFSPDASSTEDFMTGIPKTVSGMAALKEKADQFQQTVEQFHSSTAGKPSVFGNHIFVELGMDVTMKGRARGHMREMAHYEVKDGKIISESFYY